MDTLTTIQAVVNTLNTISVSGERNLSNLLGCIQILNSLREKMESEAKPEQTDGEKKDGDTHGDCDNS